MSLFEDHNFRSRLFRKSLEKVLGIWERMSGARLTYHARPRRADDAGIFSDPCPSLPPFALVLQGPVMQEDDFTLETIRLYKRTFPDAQLILSTWKKENPACLNRFKPYGVEIVTSDPPATPGQQNFNYQLVSARAGVERASQLGAQYVAKTRTDQRMYAINVQPLLMNLLDAFPLNSPGLQRKRIVGTSLATFRYRLYGMTDMFVFGHVDDMMLYWGAAQTDTRAPASSEPRTWRQTSGDCLCEVYLATEFLKAVGHNPQWTLADSWRAFGRNFCVIDRESVDLYWPKYERFREHRRLSYATQRSDRFLTFLEWLAMYTGQAFESAVPEQILDEKSMDILAVPSQSAQSPRAKLQPARNM